TIMIQMVSLDHRFSRPLSSPGSAHSLKKQLESLFSCPVVSAAQRKVCRQHTHQGHPGKIMTFHNHLGAYEHVCLSSSESGKDFLMIIFFSGSICIHPQDLCSGKTFQYQTLNLLGAGPESSDIGRPAYRAFLYVHGLIAAVMADQPAVS